MSKFRSTLAITGALATAIALAACSSPSGSTSTMTAGSSASPSAFSTGTGAFNNQDVVFAQMMVPHHEQAIAMAEMYLAKDGTDHQVAAFAEKVKAAQGPEVNTMNSWLKAWGATGGDNSMQGMDHGSGTGMMSDQDMSALKDATGTEASKLFLTQMTQHHQGAIDMARKEVAAGKNTDAVTLANSIIKDQTAEIAQMQDLLTGL